MRLSELDELVAEADRQFTLCNACRYCEDYCAVFPAMELRTAFAAGDVSYLANVCYDCRACHQACPFTEPHEFAINIPALMSEARIRSYERYARPRWLAGLFTSGPLALSALTFVALGLLFALYALLGELGSLDERRTGPGAFYEVVPHAAMAVPALLLTIYGAVVLGAGFVAFWRESGGRARDLADLRLWSTGMREAATLRWMQGGGGDCFYPEEERATPIRRWMHHLVAYGFLATFGATIAAFVGEQLLDSHSPFPVLSVPVQLGLWGGVAAVVGSVGLIVLRVRASRRLATDGARKLDVSFLVVLLAVSLTGIALLVFRETSAMGPLLLIHLGTVLALFVTAPYGKLVHAVYRTAATIRSAQERQADG